MELIKKDNNSIDKYLCCSECKDKENITQFGKIHNDDICYLCPNCLIIAVLIVRPIEFNKNFIIDWLDSQKNRRDDMDKFIKFVKPFLESK